MEGQYILKIANLTLCQLRPLLVLGVWTTTSSDDSLARVHAALSSAAQLVQPDQSGLEHSEVNGTAPGVHESKYFFLPSPKFHCLENITPRQTLLPLTDDLYWDLSVSVCLIESMCYLAEVSPDT